VLAPDPAAAQQQLTQHVDAATVVTQYAQAVQTLVAAYEDVVTDAGVRAVVDGAQRHAQTWTSGLCASCADTVPHLFVDFAGAFEAQEQAMGADVRALLVDASDQTARDDLAARLNALSVALVARGGSAAAVRRDLQTFQSTIQADHDAITVSLAALEATGQGSILVQRAQAALELDFLQPQQLSPCLAIVQIDEQVSINLAAVAGAPRGGDIVAAVLVEALLAALRTHDESAGQALSDLADTWQVLVDKYTSTAADLARAEGAGIAAVLQEMDLQASAAAWNQLAAFARSVTAQPTATTSEA
jgi:hypothetical protein